MSDPDTLSPLARGWVAAIHASEEDFEPLGTGVVIDQTRVLTCAHVVAGWPGTGPLWVAFPMADDPLDERRRVVEVRADRRPVSDVAVLVLDAPVPVGAQPAPLRCPPPSSLPGTSWWALGFARADPRGNSAAGTVGEHLGYGWVRLDVESRYVVERGLSGGALWSGDYGGVVGIVGQGNDRGDGQAITLYQVDRFLPADKIRSLADRWDVAAAGELALAAWGWSLSSDPEAGRHWRPRARGVSIDSERGQRFRGRTLALRQITAWLDRPDHDRRVLVLTGSPGVGKSAVLGRVVTTSDPAIVAALPADDEAVRATVGSVACAVHAKGKSALDVAVEIARAASAPLPERLEDLAPTLRQALTERAAVHRFNVVIDALDEASSPADARAIVSKLVLPLVETCTDLGAQVVVGTRRSDAGGDLLLPFGAACTTIDLDDPGYFDKQDLVAYALATLQLLGDERPANPYADPRTAAPTAGRIADLAEPNFLVAGLVARAHGLHDEVAVAPALLSFEPTVEAALQDYLAQVPAVDGIRAADVLAALALAEAPGLPLDVWRTAVTALTHRAVSVEALSGFARGAVANFLIESGHDVQAPAFRLYHQALNDALLHARDRAGHPRASDDRAVAQALLAQARAGGWDTAAGYVLRSLAGHADRGGVIDTVLAEEQYLLRADLRRLVPFTDQAKTRQGRARARLLQLTPRAFSADPPARLALFSVTEAIESLGATFAGLEGASPYRARWAIGRPRPEQRTLEGHTDWVRAVCALAIGGREMLASAGDDATVRIWDPVTGDEQCTLTGHTGWVYGVCAIQVAGRALLASAGADGTVRIWDPAASIGAGLLHTLTGHTGWVYGVCAIQVDGRPLLASAGDDGTVRIWDPLDGGVRQVITGHAGAVYGVCTVRVGDRQLLASAGADMTVRLWDPGTGAERHILHGHTDWVRGVCGLQVGEHTLLASAGADGTVRIWDPVGGHERYTLSGHTGGVYGLCTVQLAGRAVLASAGDDGRVRIWDPVTGDEQRRTLTGHADWIYGLCAVQVGDRELLASAGDDGTVRIWDPGAADEHRSLTGHTDWVYGLCAAQIAGRVLLASAGADGTVRTRDPITGDERHILSGHTGWVYGVCSMQVGGRDLLASAGDDATVRIWDPVGPGGPVGTGLQRTLIGHTDWVRSVCAVQGDGQARLASAGADGTVRIWDPDGGDELVALEGHDGWVYAVCPVQVAGRALLASAGADGTVRIWDPDGGDELVALEGHDGWVYAVCPVQVAGRQLLASAGADGTVRIWDPVTAGERLTLEGHTDWVYAVCPVQVAGRALLASAGDDRTVRIWDPLSGVCKLVIPVHHQALALAVAEGYLVVGLSAGLIALSLTPP